MIDHTGIGVADVGRSANSYDAALGALGKGAAAIAMTSVATLVLASITLEGES
jgi:hypothetical protein